MSTAGSSLRSGIDTIAAELSLLCVHLAVVAGFGRLYVSGDYLGDLVAFTVIAHLLAILSRRVHLPTAAAAVVGVGGAAVTATVLLFPETISFGLPTGTTWTAVREAVDIAGDRFRTVAAPTKALVGFQLLSGLALWGAVWFADWAAFRLRATAEALAPGTILFVFCTILGSGRNAFVTAVGFAVAVVLFAVTHRAMLAGFDNAWLATSPAEGARAVRRAGLRAAAATLLVGAVVAPQLPGYGDDAVIHWRDRDSGAGARTTVSPIVDLRRRLVNQSDREMFQVEANAESYWRMTSLSTFDGKIWSSGDDFTAVDSQLPTSGPIADQTQTITQRIRILDLTALWVPAAYQPRALRSASRGLRWNADTSTLIVDSSSVDSNGLAYEVTSARPQLDPTQLKAAQGPDPADLAQTNLALPDTFPAMASALARQVVTEAGGSVNRYDQALALQNFFQSGSFTYTTEIDPGHGNDALVQFLQERRGYCEQFSGTYAAMARSLGIPARVAVGFTTGDRDPLEPGLFHVHGRHAHAWPEVYFPEVGWVPFEPTPGRGIPGGEAYTGLQPDQDHSDPAPDPESTAPTTTQPLAPTSAPTPPRAPEEVPVRGTVIESSQPREANRAATTALWVAALVLLCLMVVLVAPSVRAARRRRREEPRERILGAWEDAADPIRWLTGARARPTETAAEFAQRIARALAAQAKPVSDLAELATLAEWDPVSPSPESAQQAEDLVAGVRRAVDEGQTFSQKLRRRLSWREAFGLNGQQRRTTHGMVALSRR